MKMKSKAWQIRGWDLIQALRLRRRHYGPFPGEEARWSSYPMP